MAAFPDVTKIQYEGPDSKNPLAFRCYNPDEVIEGKTMKEHLRFSCAFWHTMRMNGSDPFGMPTMWRPWEDGTDSVENAKNRTRVFFEFLEKARFPYYTFHDRDVAPEGKNLAETNKNFDEVVGFQRRVGTNRHYDAVGTANLFGNPRFMHGAATSCNADFFATPPLAKAPGAQRIERKVIHSGRRLQCI